MTHYMQDAIETHRLGYGYTSVPAINVKYYGRWPMAADQEKIEEIARIDGMSAEAVSQMIFENVQESFWEDAQELAREAGYQRCYSEGRSGGWLYVQPHIGVERPRERVSTFYQGDLTIEDFGERSKWLAFQRRINRMLKYVDASLSQETDFRLELAREDQAALIRQI